MLLAAFLVEWWPGSGTRGLVQWSTLDASWPTANISPFDGAHGFIQAKVGRYIADFLFDVLTENGSRHHLVIECDGHDFHERTKEQAAHDRRRDRWMAQNGIICMRFTGSEIWRDPRKCASDIGKMIMKLLGYPEECWRAE